MDSQGINNNERQRTNWTPPMDRYFIDLMLDQARMGQKSEKTFTKYAWGQITAAFNKKFKMELDKEVLKNRHKKLKTQYLVMKALIDQNGFGWDDSRQMVTAHDESIWDEYLKAHPEAKPMRTKTMPNYYDLNEIYSNTSATGTFSRATNDDDTNGDPTPRTTPIPVTQEKEVVGLVDELSGSDGNEDIPLRKRKQKSPIPSTTRHGRKIRRSTGESMVDALKTMAMAVSSLVDKKNDTSSKKINVVEALEAVSDLDENLYLDACDLLEDDGKAKIFVDLDVMKRKKWLLRKIRPSSSKE